MSRDIRSERREEASRRPRTGQDPHPMLQYFLPENCGVSREVMTNWIRYHLGRRAHSRFGEYNGLIGHIYTANRELTQAEIEDLQQQTQLYMSDPDEYARRAGIVYRGTDAEPLDPPQAPPNQPMEPRRPRQDMFQNPYGSRNLENDVYNEPRAQYQQRSSRDNRPDASNYGTGFFHQGKGYDTADKTFGEELYDRYQVDSRQGAYPSSSTSGYAGNDNLAPRTAHSAAYEHIYAYDAQPSSSSSNQYSGQYYSRGTGAGVSTEYSGQNLYNTTMSNGRSSSATGQFNQSQYGRSDASTDTFLNPVMEGIQTESSARAGGGSNAIGSPLATGNSILTNPTTNTGRGGKVKVKKEPGRSDEGTSSFFGSPDRRDMQISSTSSSKGKRRICNSCGRNECRCVT